MNQSVDLFATKVLAKSWHATGFPVRDGRRKLWVRFALLPGGISEIRGVSASETFSVFAVTQ
jgi:hypothetical protein